MFVKQIYRKYMEKNIKKQPPIIIFVKNYYLWREFLEQKTWI